MRVGGEQRVDRGAAAHPCLVNVLLGAMGDIEPSGAVGEGGDTELRSRVRRAIRDVPRRPRDTLICPGDTEP